MAMHWSIYGGHYKTEDDFYVDREATLSCGTTLEDGEHEVYFDGGIVSIHGDGFEKTTITVKNGEFAEDTEARIETIVKKAGYWGEFIEGFEMTERGIEVWIGS